MDEHVRVLEYAVGMMAMMIMIVMFHTRRLFIVNGDNRCQYDSSLWRFWGHVL